MIVNIERILELKEELRKINEAELSDIEFHENGKKLEIDPKNIEDWAFVGLNNVDFITTHSYKRGENVFDSVDKASW